MHIDTLLITLRYNLRLNKTNDSISVPDYLITATMKRTLVQYCLIL